VLVGADTEEIIVLLGVDFGQFSLLHFLGLLLVLVVVH
jgi:hypothetical protein